MIYNITDYGASTKNEARANAAAIQSAVDAAFAAGGGTVYVPAGLFNTGNIELKSNIRLHLEQGATLFGSPNFEDYRCSDIPGPFAPLVGIPPLAEKPMGTGFIYATHAKNVSVTGFGTIDGNGKDHRFPDKRDPMLRRPMMLYFDFCENIRIQDVFLKDPAMFALWAVRSRFIQIHGVHINSWEIENGDGLDFNGSSDVCISNCIIESGDDAISLKTTFPEWANRRYTISNCVFHSVWAGIRLGVESAGDMSEIAISNCAFEDCNDALKIQNCATGRMENVRISNVVMRNVHRPLFMTVNPFRLSRALKTIRPQVGGLHDVYIDGMTAYMSEKNADYQRNAFVVSGWKGMPIENFELRNAKVVFEGKMQPGALDRVDLPEYLDYSFMYADVFSVNGDYPASGLFMRHIDGAKIENCSFVRRDDDPRPLMMIYDVKNLRMRDVSGENGADMISAIDADLLLENCLHNGAAYGAATPFSAENTEKYRAFVTLSDETSAMFDKMAAQVDEAQNMENITSIPEDAWTQEGDRCYANIRAEGEKVMLLFSSYGDGELFVNGKSAAVCRVPRLYRNMIAWAADVTALLHEGDNLVEIRWDDPADMGGADCLLPFGVFKPYRVGLTKEAQICVK